MRRCVASGNHLTSSGLRRGRVKIKGVRSHSPGFPLQFLPSARAKMNLLIFSSIKENSKGSPPGFI